MPKKSLSGPELQGPIGHWAGSRLADVRRSVEDAWRIGLGDYRVIYQIVDEQVTVTLVRSGHRRQVYDR